MGKITISHYLNKKLAPKIIEGEKLYPVYVRAGFLRNNTKFRTKNFSFLSDKDFNNKKIINALQVEKETLEYVITNLIKQGKADLITAKYLKLHSLNLNDNGKKQIASDYKEIEELLDKKKQIVNRLEYLKMRIEINENTILSTFRNSELKVLDTKQKKLFD